MSDPDSHEQNNETNQIYTLKVYIVTGQLSEEWEGEEISRKIEIRGDQTLEELHGIIFEAFDRWENHLYEFNLGKGPQDHSEIYSPPEAKGGLEEFKEHEEGDTTETTIDSLGLEEERAFGYIFDHGANWIHQIDVLSIETSVEEDDEKYPKVIERVNDSPPQYPQR